MGVFVLCSFELTSFTVGTGLHVGLAGKPGSDAAASIGRWLSISAVIVLCYFLYRDGGKKRLVPGLVILRPGIFCSHNL